MREKQEFHYMKIIKLLYNNVYYILLIYYFRPKLFYPTDTFIISVLLYYIIYSYLRLNKKYRDLNLNYYCINESLN